VKISAGFALKKDRKSLSLKIKYENFDSDSVPDDRYKVGYAVSNGSGYAVSSYLPE
ncbi:hypothetical protein Tco_0372583, partial [Tanacetum coccineum]